MRRFNDLTAPMLELEAALEKILASVPLPDRERVPLDEAHRRIVAEKISSPLPLPAFDNSAMDGYAVRAEDTAGAGPQNPIRLRLIGKAAAGDNFTGTISAS